MQSLGLGPSPAPPRPRATNWGMVAAILTIVGWMLAGASGVFGDYRNLDKRITTLESQRQNESQRLDRMESKIDRLLERGR